MSCPSPKRRDDDNGGGDGGDGGVAASFYWNQKHFKKRSKTSVEKVDIMSSSRQGYYSDDDDDDDDDETAVDTGQDEQHESAATLPKAAGNRANTSDESSYQDSTRLNAERLSKQSMQRVKTAKAAPDPATTITTAHRDTALSSLLNGGLRTSQRAKRPRRHHNDKWTELMAPLHILHDEIRDDWAERAEPKRSATTTIVTTAKWPVSSSSPHEHAKKSKGNSSSSANHDDDETNSYDGEEKYTDNEIDESNDDGDDDESEDDDVQFLLQWASNVTEVLSRQNDLGLRHLELAHEKQKASLSVMEARSELLKVQTQIRKAQLEQEKLQQQLERQRRINTNRREASRLLTTLDQFQAKR